MAVKCFLVNHGTVEISHPPYYLPLHQPTCFFSLQWKLPSKEDFQDTEDIINKYKALPLDAFNDCFMQL